MKQLCCDEVSPESFPLLCAQAQHSSHQIPLALGEAVGASPTPTSTSSVSPTAAPCRLPSTPPSSPSVCHASPLWLLHVTLALSGQQVRQQITGPSRCVSFWFITVQSLQVRNAKHSSGLNAFDAVAFPNPEVFDKQQTINCLSPSLKVRQRFYCPVQVN